MSSKGESGFSGIGARWCFARVNEAKPALENFGAYVPDCSFRPNRRYRSAGDMRDHLT
jgi:hypothetical protein